MKRSELDTDKRASLDQYLIEQAKNQRINAQSLLVETVKGTLLANTGGALLAVTFLSSDSLSVNLYLVKWATVCFATGTIVGIFSRLLLSFLIARSYKDVQSFHERARQDVEEVSEEAVNSKMKSFAGNLNGSFPIFWSSLGFLFFMVGVLLGLSSLFY